jgi:two-component system cell cycle response regulator DivK
MARATVLIVEDSPAIAQPLADAFRFSSFAVLQAGDAIQALQLASEHRPDLIIMDIQLPDLDGISAALTLKGDPETRHIPIVAMTAYDIAGDQARTLSKVCVAYYQKPIRPHDLVNLVTAILKLPPESPPAARRPSPARPPGR